MLCWMRSKVTSLLIAYFVHFAISFYFFPTLAALSGGSGLNGADMRATLHTLGKLSATS